jgi:hypothetical protein
MQITIPRDAELLAQSQAAAAGFASVDDYIANLIRLQPRRELIGSRDQALQDLGRLRTELPKLTRDEIVQSVQEGRTDLR